MALTRIDIDPVSLPSPSRATDQERAIAIFDTIENSVFHPHDPDDRFNNMAFGLGLSLQEHRLVMAVSGDQFERQYILSLNPFKALFRDYQMICDSYETALRNATASQIESIDMGRRGIHNEGAELLVERLKGKIDIGFETARRLFSLLYQLRQRL